MNKLIKELAIESGFNDDPMSIEGKYKNFDLEGFAKAILQESHSIWHAMDNGNDVEGFIEMGDFPRAVQMNSVMSFGKHKGLPLDYIIKEYPAYHKWAIQNNVPPLCFINAEPLIIIKSRPIRKNSDSASYGYDHCEIYEYGEN